MKLPKRPAVRIEADLAIIVAEKARHEDCTVTEIVNSLVEGGIIYELAQKGYAISSIVKFLCHVTDTGECDYGLLEYDEPTPGAAEEGTCLPTTSEASMPTS